MTNAPTPPPPAPLTELKINDEIRTAVNGAMANGTPMIVAYVDEDGQPSLSFRGSLQVFGDQQLAIWVRNPEGGLLRSLEKNPRVTSFYRDPVTRTTLQFRGVAKVQNDDATRKAVYDSAPENERNADREQKGIALVIDVNRVDGVYPGVRVQMRR